MKGQFMQAVETKKERKKHLGAMVPCLFEVDYGEKCEHRENQQGGNMPPSYRRRKDGGGGRPEALAPNFPTTHQENAGASSTSKQ